MNNFILIQVHDNICVIILVDWVWERTSSFMPCNFLFFMNMLWNSWILLWIVEIKTITNRYVWNIMTKIVWNTLPMNEWQAPSNSSSQDLRPTCMTWTSDLCIFLLYFIYTHVHVWLYLYFGHFIHLYSFVVKRLGLYHRYK